MAAALAVGGTARPAFAQENTFRFNPPVPLTYTITEKTTETQEFPRTGKVTEVSVQKTRVTLRRTDEGFVETQVVTSVTETRNGKRVNSPVMQAVLNTPVTFTADPDGKLRRVGGSEQLMRKIAARYPPAVRDAIMARYDRDSLNRTLRSDWSLRVGQLLGHSAREGEEWSVEDEFSFHGAGMLRGTVAYRVGGEAACGKGTCVRVRRTQTPDPDQLRQSVEDELAQGMQGRMEGVKVSVLDLKGSETTDVRIDPATLLPYAARGTSTVSFNADLGGEITVPVLMQTTTVQTFEYGAPSKPGARPSPRPKAVKRKTRR